MPELSYEEVQTWKVDALKIYCRRRNLKVTGSKAELVARVFAASEMGIPIQPTAKERIYGTETEKGKLLQAPNNTMLPDPYSLQDGWLRENDGLTSWPPIFLSDITVFLMADHPGKDVDFHKRVMNEYKEGKAFRLFDSGFLKEVSYHQLSPESEYCFLKAKCTHSMKITDTPHTAWVSAVKSTGNIFSAYCSCVAGMSSSCIHVTALLFRIEAANRNGLTNPACTAKQCEWNVPAEKTIIKPRRICEMEWKAAKLNKDIRRSLFEPVEKKCRQSDKEKRELWYKNLNDVLPDSCFVMMNDAEHQVELPPEDKS